jgi:hypothetical protein
MRHDLDWEPWYWRPPFVDLWRVALDPAEEGEGIDRNAALRHHFSQIAIADAVLALPAQAALLIRHVA